MDYKTFIRNEDAVSISIGFILTFSITVMVFITVMLSYQEISQQSENTANIESFKIMGSGLANKLMLFDMLINSTRSNGGRVNTLDYEFSISPPITGKDYSINITNNRIKIESDDEAKVLIPFNTSTEIIPTEIFSNVRIYKLSYNINDDKIKIGPP